MPQLILIFFFLVLSWNLLLQENLPKFQETSSPLELRLQLACPSPTKKNPRRHPKWQVEPREVKQGIEIVLFPRAVSVLQCFAKGEEK